MSEHEQDERAKSEDDANEDLELKDEDADQVRGGLAQKGSPLRSSDGAIK